MTVELTERRAWAALRTYAQRVEATDLRTLFAEDPGRAARLTRTSAGLTIDFSKNLVDQDVLDMLLELARRVHVPSRVESMFRGERINRTEDRPALHVALRSPSDAVIGVDGVNVVPAVHEVLDQMASIADQLRGGHWTGSTGRRIRTVVNIGIGGFDLGPRMACAALRPYGHPVIGCRFVSNVDGADFTAATADLDPAETLFVIASKTFTTPETMTNARTAREWIVSGLGTDAAVAKHFIAVSTNTAEVARFGIAPDNLLRVWDWVGGRYSLCSAVGLPLMISIGPKCFGDLLAGFHAMDEHFRFAPPAENLPMLLGLIGVWHRNFLGAHTHAVVPYAEQLAHFPAYLQQLEMESNGKRVDLLGHQLRYDTAPVLWSTPGTGGQHACFQLLHQGTQVVPVDLIGFAQPSQQLPGHHDLLMATMFAHSEALAFGQSEKEAMARGVSAELAPHRSFPGNRPSTTILADRLTPYVLGSLVALYEHKVFTQGALWGIDSFDQWGGELGSSLAGRIATELLADDDPILEHDASTNGLIQRYRRLRRSGH